MNFYVAKNGMILALAMAWPVVKGEWCGETMEVEYCGSTVHIDVKLICTPFPVRKSDYEVAGDWCKSTDMIKYSGSKNGAQAWQSSDKSNYWVFHGCDGAGFMDDCKGGSTYVEQFGAATKIPTFIVPII